MAPNYYLKPETALGKAKELINVGKKLNALEILYDMMKSKRSRVWHKSLQDLMIILVDLCVELNKNSHFRKVIHQYKSIAAQECPQSIEFVLRYYLTEVKKCTHEAQQKSQDAMLDIEDLDSLESPETLMLTAVTTEGAQDRSSRAILMPWLRFLWDAYRIVLDLLRTMPKFDRMYHEIAQETYDFCVKFARKNEFKKLTETLRVHTIRNQWQINQAATNIETQQQHLHTRLKQLDCALDLEMYNDAFKAVEDIWATIMNFKKAAKAPLLSEYYGKAADLFLRSGCHLFHAAALYKLMQHHRDNKRTLTKEDLAGKASQVLCAILSIPMPQERMSFDKLLISGESNTAKMKSLANLLGLSVVPTRQSLIKEFLSNRMIVSLIPVELTQLYTAFEVEFQPMKLYENSKASLEFVTNHPELNVYSAQLQEVIMAKTILQISQVFQSIDFTDLCKLCPFVQPLLFERFLVELIHNLELPIRLDHRNNSVHFDVFTDMGISQRKYGPLTGLPCINMPASSTNQLTRQINIFAEVLQTITLMLPGTSDELEQNSLMARKQLITSYNQTQKNNRKELLNRKNLTEERIETLENLRKERAKYMEELENKRREKMQREAEEEEARLQDEAREREQRRVDEEETNLRRKVTRQQINMIMNKGAESGGATSFATASLAGNITSGTGAIKKGTSVVDDVLGATCNVLKKITDEQLDQIDTKKILEKKKDEMMKKTREQKEKAKQRAKQLDYFTRAMRLEEIAWLKTEALEESQKFKEFVKLLNEEREKKAQEKHEQMLADRDRLKRMAPQIDVLKKELSQRSKEHNEKQLEAWQKLCEEERVKQLEIRRLQEEEELKRQDERRRKAETERAQQDNTANARSTELSTTDVDNGYVLVNESSLKPSGPWPGSAASSGPAKYVPPKLREARNRDSCLTGQSGTYQPTIASRGNRDSFSRNTGGGPSTGGGFGGGASASTGGDGGWVRSGGASSQNNTIRDERPNQNSFSYGNQSQDNQEESGWKLSRMKKH